MANKKYAKFLDAELEVKTFRWPYWLLPLLFVSLLLVLGLFIFITIHSTDSFGCFFHCQKIDNGGVLVPDVSHLRDENGTETTPKHGERQVKSTEEPHSSIPQQKDKNKHKDDTKDVMVLSGKLIFPRDAPETLKNNSFAKVSFEDTGLMDSSSKVLAVQEFQIDGLYKKGHGLDYKIKCTKPDHQYPFYSVSAVVNVGWKRNKGSWIKEGDFFTDTQIPVRIKPKQNNYRMNITLVKYG